jgi:hypothetical protein
MTRSDLGWFDTTKNNNKQTNIRRMEENRQDKAFGKLGEMQPEIYSTHLFDSDESHISHTCTSKSSQRGWPKSDVQSTSPTRAMS